MRLRLNKYLAEAGVASRRQADRMIVEGRVSVNGQVVQELGFKVDAEKDRVAVDGKHVRKRDVPTYIALNKPAGYLVTMKDSFERPTVSDLLPVLSSRVFPVGRLDLASEGLLLFTNDGELAYRLTHPRYQVKKTYIVKVRGEPSPSALSRLQKGMYIDGQKTAPAEVVLLERSLKRSIFRIDIHEGKKREIRRIFDIIGHRVLSLKRVAFGGLALGKLQSGKWRFLRQAEVERLKKQVGLT